VEGTLGCRIFFQYAKWGINSVAEFHAICPETKSRLYFRLSFLVQKSGMTESTRIVIPTFEDTKNPRANAIQIGIVVVILIAIFSLVGFLILNAPVSANQRIVSFRIEGSGGTARITYTQPDGSQSDPTFVSIPWESSGKYYRSTMKVYLTAGSTQSNGTISCVMKLDGQEWKRDSSSGAEGKVACGGIVP
jgi:hypothetical protein